MERRQIPAKQKASGKRRAAVGDAAPKAKRRQSAAKIKAIPEVPVAKASAQEKAAKQELIAPHEWATMLNAPENEFADSSGAPIPEAPYTEVMSDDLWERLSSTRWIKLAPEHDLHNRSTIVNRPSN
jgi:hypothetical protein